MTLYGDPRYRELCISILVQITASVSKGIPAEPLRTFKTSTQSFACCSREGDTLVDAVPLETDRLGGEVHHRRHHVACSPRLAVWQDRPIVVFLLCVVVRVQYEASPNIDSTTFPWGYFRLFQIGI